MDPLTPPDRPPPLMVRGGVPLETARAAMVLVHGRGASARDILTITSELPSEGWSFVAPEAPGGLWYPYPFTAPIEANEPWLGAALETVAAAVREVAEVIPRERVVVLGFSQGACLALEFAARNATRYGGVVGLSGGLIGADGSPREYPGSLTGTPVFLGCSDIDPHIPRYRVEEAAAVLADLGADVVTRIYPQMAHTINTDEVDAVRELMDSVGAA